MNMWTGNISDKAMDQWLKEATERVNFRIKIARTNLMMTRFMRLFEETGIIPIRSKPVLEYVSMPWLPMQEGIYEFRIRDRFGLRIIDDRTPIIAL